MSAIVALVQDEPGATSSDWLVAATELSRSAGPDGHRHQQIGRCGLGHALLQTGVDALGPISLNGQLWITADARLDDRANLCATLRAGGADTSASDPDARLLLHAYEQWGQSMVERISGDFVFAIWDTGREQLFCGRDQLGVGVFHYARPGRTLVVSTCLEPLLAHPAVDDTLDEQAIVDFIVFGYYTDPSATAFAAIRQLPPGHVLVWTRDGVRIRPYWRFPHQPPLARFASLEAGARKLLEVLDVAVADRVTGSRASAQLSGGMDSTTVAASTLRALSARGAPPGALRAFTGMLGGDTGDREGEFARLTADKLQVPLDLVDASAEAVLDPFDDPQVLTPEPVRYDFSGYLLHYARVPAAHAPVAFTGQGGDALFGFVPWYWLEWLSRGRIGRLAGSAAQQLRLTGCRPHPRLRMMVRWARRSHLAPAPLPNWLLPDVIARTGVIERQRDLAPRPFGVRARHLDARGLAFDPQWAALFRLGDPAFTRQPVRFRHPYFDLRLIAFAQSLAPEPWLMDKRILREAGRTILPEVVRTRPKTPLVSAAPHGVEDDLLGLLAELVRSCGELGQFCNTNLLVRSILPGDRDTDARRTWARHRALGLAHWLWHRSAHAWSPRTATGCTV